MPLKTKNPPSVWSPRWAACASIYRSLTALFPHTPAPCCNNNRCRRRSGSFGSLGYPPIIQQDVKKSIREVLVPGDRVRCAGFWSYGRPRRLAFNIEAWTEGDLRYFVVGDANPNDVQN